MSDQIEFEESKEITEKDLKLFIERLTHVGILKWKKVRNPFSIYHYKTKVGPFSLTLWIPKFRSYASITIRDKTTVDELNIQSTDLLLWFSGKRAVKITPREVYSALEEKLVP